VALAPLLVIVLSLVGSSMTLVERLQKSGGAQEALKTLLTTEAAPAAGPIDLHRVMEFAQSHGSDALNAATKLFGAASAGTIGVIVFIYGFYTCLVEGPRAYAWLLEHSPLERWQTTRLTAAYEETGRGLLIGVGLTALFQGAVATVGYAIIGVPQALVFGLVTALGALIPSVGTALVWVPLAIGLFAAGQKGSAAAVVGLGAVVSVADNFVRPLLSRHGQLDLPGFLLFVAMLGGIVTFGGWGLLVGPLFVRLALEALRLGRERHELGQASTLLKTEEP
jgi:predicted PurR-regulated permease PerM